MAVNNDESNKLYAVNDTGVKFFCSLTRRLAKGQDSFIYENESHTINDFPGAICYVSDNDGNSIYLNKLLFGDGAISGGGGSGTGGGITEVSLDIIPVVEVNGTVLKTLLDYFNADGTFITEGINILGIDGSGNPYNAVEISTSGVKIGGLDVATQDWVLGLLYVFNSTITNAANEAEENAKEYAKGLITSVYKVKGTIPSLSALYDIANPSIGDVYNVGGDLNGINYVYTERGWDSLGGSVNLENYYTKDDVNTKVSDSLEILKSYTDTKIGEVSLNLLTIQTTVITLSGSVSQVSTAVSNNTTNIAQNTQNITQISTQLTWQ